MKVKLKLFFRWGIRFDENNPYIVKESGNRKVQYAEQSDIRIGIMRRYHLEVLWEEKSYEDAKAEISDFTDEADEPFGDELQENKLQKSKLQQGKNQQKHQQSKKGTIRTAPRQKNNRGGEPGIADTGERGVE